MFESVLLPAPFSPRSACTSPSAASKSTWSFASTAGNRFVMPRSATAGAVAVEGGEAMASPPEPVHRVQVLDRQSLALRDAQLALLVVERSGELVERALDQGALLRRNR